MLVTGFMLPLSDVKSTLMSGVAFLGSYGFEDLLPYSHRIYDFENYLNSEIYAYI